MYLCWLVEETVSNILQKQILEIVNTAIGKLWCIPENVTF